MCERVFSVGFGPVLASMSPARSRRSDSHAVGTHGWLPQKKLGGRASGESGYMDTICTVPPPTPDCDAPTTCMLYPFGAPRILIIIVPLHISIPSQHTVLVVIGLIHFRF